MSLASSMPMSPSAEQRVLGGPPVAPSSPIAAGAVAPAFELAAAPDRKVALSDFVGQTVILVFYPADWSPVCTDQLALYNELLPLFTEHRAQVLGISVDGSLEPPCVRQGPQPALSAAFRLRAERCGIASLRRL